jgi:hypothetical protein
MVGFGLLASWGAFRAAESVRTLPLPSGAGIGGIPGSIGNVDPVTCRIERRIRGFEAVGILRASRAVAGFTAVARRAGT